MAITICKECGNVISLNAEACPKCGSQSPFMSSLEEYKFIKDNYHKYPFPESKHLVERMEELEKTDDEVKKNCEEINKEIEEKTKKKLQEEQIVLDKKRKRNRYIAIGAVTISVGFIVLLMVENNNRIKELARMEAYNDSVRIVENSIRKEQEFLEQMEHYDLVQKSIKIISVAPTRERYSRFTDLNVYYKNISDKTIKYFIFEAIGYNSVGDAVSAYGSYTGIYRGKDTGPVKPGHKGGGQWSGVWYGTNIKNVAITRVEIEYMDGTKLECETPEIITISK